MGKIAKTSVEKIDAEIARQNYTIPEQRIFRNGVIMGIDLVQEILDKTFEFGKEEK